MSHFTKIGLQFKDLEILKTALQNLDATILEEGKNIRMKNEYGFSDSYVDILCEHKSLESKFGFKKKGEEYELIIDEWEINLEKHKKFSSNKSKNIISSLSEEYVCESIKSSSKYKIRERKYDKNGNIQLVVEEKGKISLGETTL